MAPELVPLFLVVGVFAAWGLGRWGWVSVLVSVILFWRSLLFAEENRDSTTPGMQPDPFIAETHTSPGLAWLAVGLTAVGFCLGYVYRQRHKSDALRP